MSKTTPHRSAPTLVGLLFRGVALCSIWTLSAFAQDPAANAPEPAPPISSPRPGMAWEIEIRPAMDSPAGGNPTTARARHTTRIAGRRGPNASLWTVQLPGSTETILVQAGDRLFAWNEKTGKLTLPELRDGNHDEALSFRVRGFPGVSWVTPDKKGTLERDSKTGSWRTTYIQEAHPFEIIDEGTEEEYAVPTGPSVRVEAIFDAVSGLPIEARVDDKIYTYRITRTDGVNPEPPPALRQALEARLQREASLQDVLRRREQKPNR